MSSILRGDRKRKCAIVGLSPLESFYADLLPSNENRSGLVDSLIEAYQLNQCDNVEKIAPADTRISDFTKFHAKSYVRYLTKPRLELRGQLDPQKRQLLNQIMPDEEDISSTDTADEDSLEDELNNEEAAMKYGLAYDCPIFPYMKEYVQVVAGSTLSAVNWLIEQRTSDQKLVAMNWHGGRHHGLRDRASGFCYVNDVVLGTTKLRARFPKIIYIDFDLHHGDGVSRAFKMSNKVLTVSLHRYDVGFFPGTGDLLRDKGLGNGLNYDVNLPMRKGLSNKILLEITETIVLPLIDQFGPDCLVIQCGCDGLNSDEHKEWNLTIKGLSAAIERILMHSQLVPALLLGGGGYNHTEAAKFWTYLTATVSQNTDQWDLIPDHSKLDEYEKDSYEFWKNERETNMKDLNDDHEWLQFLKKEILSRYIR